MYWKTNPDGSMSRKLVEDWTDEEKALHERHEAFLKEAEALGYVFSLNTDTLKWTGRFQMTFKEQIKQLPETDRAKFFRALIKVSEAGRNAGVLPKEWGELYADITKNVDTGESK